MTRLTARRSVLIDAPPDVVWRIHTDIDNWSRWHSAISIARALVAPDVGSRFEWKSSGLSIQSTIRTFERDKRISWTGTALGTRAEHTWILESQNGRTLVTSEESMEGWLVTLLRATTPAFLERSLDVWLRDLKSAAEDAAGGHATAESAS